ncbi:MAG: hypothetical protein EKK41_20250 [Hyphomicrobiales bacterium]|nr:MAG: hypothetical protein EKK41_20250 [Hyphomicrobiales bacterium]
MRGALPVPSPETHLFSFALVGDTHVKPTSGDQSAPWKVNEKATARARFVAREMARYEPKFIIHLGDLVHPVPELATFGEAVQLTQDVFRQHHNKMHVLPGNHDIGDKPNRMMPAKGIRESWIDIHEATWGAGWRSFDEGGVRFVLLNNPILNSGLPREAQQYAWLEETLATAGDRRLFVFMHYPLYLLSADEPGTYDNIDEPARSRLLTLFERHKVEAVFAGHVHNIFYHRKAGAEFYVMMATSFVRQDYAEMFRIEAVHENGRDDAEKLGFAIVDVHSDGHVVHYIRSYGSELDEAAAAAPIARRSSLALPNPKRAAGAPIGVFLRHPWAETVRLPQNGPMDEFLRKEARNDYQVAALWRLGIRHLRVPVSDVMAPESRARMGDLAAIGHRFTVSGFGVPSGAVRDTVLATAPHIDRYEIVLPADEMTARREEIAAFRDALGRPVTLAPVATSADDVKVGSKIELFVSHGWSAARLGDIAALIETGIADGFVVRAGMGDDLPALARMLSDLGANHGRRFDLHLRIAANNPAANVRDDAAILRAVIELYVTALAFPDVAMFADPFMDIDRGYFVRHGLIDRRCNLRAAGCAVEALTAYLGQAAGRVPFALETQCASAATTFRLTGAGLAALIILPLDDRPLPLNEMHRAQMAAAPLVVPLDQPWAVSSLGTDPVSPRTGLPDRIEGPTMFIGRAASA